MLRFAAAAALVTLEAITQPDPLFCLWVSSDAGEPISCLLGWGFFFHLKVSRTDPVSQGGADKTVILPVQIQHTFNV